MLDTKKLLLECYQGFAETPGDKMMLITSAGMFIGLPDINQKELFNRLNNDIKKTSPNINIDSSECVCLKDVVFTPNSSPQACIELATITIFVDQIVGVFVGNTDNLLPHKI